VADHLPVPVDLLQDAHRREPGTRRGPPERGVRRRPKVHDEATARRLGERRVEVAAPDEGATTLAVILIAAGALAAGASAGFAGGRRGVLRAH